MAITRAGIESRRRPATVRNYRLMLTAYKAMGQNFIDRLNKYGLQVITDHDIKVVDIDPIKPAYDKVIRDTALDFARYGRKEFKRRKAYFEPDESLWITTIEANITQLVNTFSDRLYTNAIETIRKISRGYVDEGIQSGMSIASITERINAMFFADWGDNYKWMARRVAQTETIRASNFGTKAGVQSLGVEYLQSWLCAHDEKTRETHLQAWKDNQRIPADQKFVVGGFECDYPGDPGLPPQESINCRCSWTAEPADYAGIMES